jgi:hypothetical protein
MPYFAHQDVLDNGILYLKANVNQIRLLSTYAFNDSFATVSANTVAFVNPLSADTVISSDGFNRRFGFGDFLVTASGSTSGEFFLHVACVDTTTSKVLWVTECRENRQVLSGTQTIIPSAVYTAKQPVAGL